MAAPLSTTLGGTLQRHPQGWCWSDGTPEPRVRDMLLSHLAPNFRCCDRGGITYVEIPARWRDARYWPGGQIDASAAQEIDALLRECGQRSAIYLEGLAEALDDHRLTGEGWRVDIAQWEAVMREPVGCWWDKREEADILPRARALGWGA